MNSKNTVFLLIVALGVIAAVIYQKQNEEHTFAAAEIPEKAIPEITSGTLDRIVIETPGEKNVTLSRSEDKWYTNLEKKYEADENAVGSAIKALEKPVTANVVSSNPDSYDDYQVSETSATKVTFYTTGEKKPELEILIGKDGPSAFTTYVRLADTKDVLNARASLSMAFKRPDGWRNHQVFQFPGSNTTAVETKGTSATFTVAKNADSKWMFAAPETGEAESVRISSISNMMANLRANDFIDPTSTQTLASLGLDPPRQTISLGYEDKTTSPSKNTTATLLIGNQVEPDGDWYAKRSDKNDIFTIGSHVADALSPDPKTILVPPPPAPEPATTPTETMTSAPVVAEETLNQPPTPAPAEEETTSTTDNGTPSSNTEKAAELQPVANDKNTSGAAM